MRSIPILLVSCVLAVAVTTNVPANLEPCCKKCVAPLAHFWALDTPNNECAETCLNPKNDIAMAEWWTLTGGKGKRVNTSATPCKTAGFSQFNRTDIVGVGPLKEQLDKYLPDVMKTPAAACPTVSPYAALNRTEFVRASWYSQQQQYTGYQQADHLFCVAATYNDEGKTVPFFGGSVLAVHNYADENAVNGKATHKQNDSLLCARVPDKKTPAKLLVAPCFIPNNLAGDYWVLAAGPSEQMYEWAIVSAGQPTVKYSDGCTTKESGTNGAGFWLFSRSPVASAETLQQMRQKAKSLGFTLSRLHDVAQQGCKYTDAFLKH